MNRMRLNSIRVNLAIVNKYRPFLEMGVCMLQKINFLRDYENILQFLKTLGKGGRDEVVAKYEVGQ